MNSRQKEVYQATLHDEQVVMKRLESNYTSALARIRRNIKELQANPLTQSKAYQLEFQKQLEAQISGILDTLQGNNFSTIADYLNTCYQTGFIGTAYDWQGQGVPLTIPIDQKQVIKAVQKTGDDFKLSNKLGVNTKLLKEQVKTELQRGLASQMTYADIARNITEYGQSDMNRSMLIARTEGHRVQNDARLDAMQAAKKKGADIVKQWDSTLDGKTRPNHRLLDGQVRELDEAFEVSGMKVNAPGHFGIAAEDCNCRCCLLQRARWALKEKVDPNTGEVTYEDKEPYQKWNNEDGGFIKCSGFKDFEQKYIKQTKSLKSSSKGGNITIQSCSDFTQLSDYLQKNYGIQMHPSVSKLSLDVVKRPLMGYEDMVQDFPELGQSVQTVMTSNRGVMSCAGDKISFNPAYFSDLQKLEGLCQQYGGGWWVANVSPESIGVHESAHAVEWILCQMNPSNVYDWQKIMAYNQCAEAKGIVSRACKNIKKTPFGKGKKNDELKQGISRYALDNPSETLAEAFADVYANGKNAHPLSTEIRKLTVERYKHLKGGGVP